MISKQALDNQSVAIKLCISQNCYLNEFEEADR